ncbi:hypothetical protein M430DRAFT_33912 [Amorphotheca resinae ATCC 22711]|jgi:hypothetical protein|uniref:WW domain-containing protein n=1 Tax=Amorphotheca resinae ATCC 22711 TaxID=857342 RepID=A0A2T3B9B1_AMORE|nr:hypothetical protein M430DRAFT_33912 [Amorphotheca resinae ATCC 22711]PSS23464.1 hypothetical protein M430DRAFT_33912 [Amorphotheca resinae ATCC 22711]
MASSPNEDTKNKNLAPSEASKKEQDAVSADVTEEGEYTEPSEAADASTKESGNADKATASTGDADTTKEHNGVSEASGDDGAPPLPEESIPPLPEEAPPAATEEDDGWAPIWDQTAQAFYFYNRFTGATQWNNPRVPDAPNPGAPGVEASASQTDAMRVAGGYNPAIHGDYDPTAWYAQPAVPEETAGPSTDPAEAYAATAAFNRFTGRFQNADLTPERFSDENKSKRQMNAFFDVDAAANSHDGRSLKEERSGKKLTKAELKRHKEKRKAKKEEKRRAWLLD